MADDFKYHKFLQPLVDEDVRFILEREKVYQSSWKKSGGRSAYFMLARKMDRLINMMNKKPKDFYEATIQHDIFAKISDDPSGNDGTVLAEIRDLRRYLIMVESEMMSQGVVELPFCQGHHKPSAHRQA